jgi:RNA polymerase sigma-70 factor (ECF subfamily)
MSMIDRQTTVPFGMLPPTRVLDEYRPRVYAFIRRRGFNGEDADDLTQETLMRAYQHLGGFRGSSLSTWLCSIARNLTVDHLRRQRINTVPLEGLDSEPTSEDDPQAELVGAAEQHELRDRLSELPAAYRRLLQLRYYENRSLNDIGLMLNCSPTAAKLRVFRAVVALRKLIHQHQTQEDRRAG